MVASETAPLLSNRNGYHSVPISTSPSTTPSSSDNLAPGQRLDPSLLESATELTPSERRASLLKWLLFWFLFSLFLYFLISKAISEGSGEIDWWGALQKAGGGGLSGAMAMIIQVITLMPLRTIMNYQYRYSGKLIGCIKLLYGEGGYGRFYAGIGPALFQGPIARFGDTAANVGIFALLDSNPYLSQLPSPLKTAFASIAGALFRMILVPLDTLKTTMQTHGKDGVKILKDRIKAYGIGTLWYGAFATAAASFVGSYPWFATFNYLQTALPPATSTALNLLRNAFIGFAASVTSDTVSNSLRVLKTYRQVNQTRISYREAARTIVRAEGLRGLFGRGLATRLLANGLQGLMFSVLWKYFQALLAGDDKKLY